MLVFYTSGETLSLSSEGFVVSLCLTGVPSADIQKCVLGRVGGSVQHLWVEQESSMTSKLGMV